MPITAIAVARSSEVPSGSLRSRCHARNESMPASAAMAAMRAVSMMAAVERGTPRIALCEKALAHPSSKMPSPMRRCAPQASGGPNRPNHRARDRELLWSRSSPRTRLAIQLTSRPHVRGQVKDDQDENPHGVHEVPVQGDDFDRQVIDGGEPSSPGVELEPHVHQQPHGHVGSVESGDGEEQRAIHVGAGRELLQGLVVLEALEREERGAHQEGQEEAELQPANLAFPDAHVGPVHRSAREQQDGRHDRHQGQLRFLDPAGGPHRSGLKADEEIAGQQDGEQGGLGEDQDDHAPPAGRLASFHTHPVGGQFGLRPDPDRAHGATPTTIGGPGSSSSLTLNQNKTPPTAIATPMTVTATTPVSRPAKIPARPNAVATGTYEPWGMGMTDSSSASTTLVPSVSCPTRIGCRPWTACPMSRSSGWSHTGSTLRTVGISRKL